MVIKKLFKLGKKDGSVSGNTTAAASTTTLRHTETLLPAAKVKEQNSSSAGEAGNYFNNASTNNASSNQSNFQTDYKVNINYSRSSSQVGGLSWAPSVSGVEGASVSQSNIINQYNSGVYDLKTPQELVSIATLLNCHASRIYHQSDETIEEHVEFLITESFELDLNSFEPIEMILKGAELILFKKKAAEFQPIIININESMSKFDDKNLMICFEFDSKKLILKFNNLTTLKKWLSCIKLSNFEYIRLNESYTASLLSAKAAKLSDIHVVLADTRFEHEEWCNIKLSYSNQWRKLYCIITPYDKKNWKGVKNGIISFYSSSRTSKKNLVLTIPFIENCFAIYPNSIENIDDSTLLKINGNFRIYNEEYLLTGEKKGSSASASSTNTPKIGRSRSNSIATNSSATVVSSNRHLRTGSMSSISSNKSISKSFEVKNDSIYIIPNSHNGVQNFETLIRFLIPIYDSFQLYGRPKRLISQKQDVNSLLFGLPQLPQVSYLSTRQAYELVSTNWQDIITQQDYHFDKLFQTFIKHLYLNNAYKGFGHLKSSVYNDANFEIPVFTGSSTSIPTSPSPTTPLTLSEQNLLPQTQPQSQPYGSKPSPINNSPSSSQFLTPRMNSYSNLNSLAEENLVQV